jgi:predicted MFS family arabinose efflux permease
MGASFIVFNIFPWPHAVAMIAIILLTFGEIAAMPFMNTYWSSRTLPSNMGQYAALYSVAWSVGQILGPGTGARIADSYGFATLWYFVGGLAVVTAFGYRWMLNREKLALRTDSLS